MVEHDAALLGAYAIGALDEGERAELERHLVDWPECAEEAAVLIRTRSLLGLLRTEGDGLG
jgi:anti-sigma factor RsiW